MTPQPSRGTAEWVRTSGFPDVPKDTNNDEPDQDEEQETEADPAFIPRHPVPCGPREVAEEHEPGSPHHPACHVVSGELSVTHLVHAREPRDLRLVPTITDVRELG